VDVVKCVEGQILS